ncbi:MULTISPECIES: beta-glucosidase BglX [unclassified Paraflavitalea]|uniref:beta-glucosidase BglX n=1 Tax=unclassified Paraflavitalea TaxID=2798305 RepID=UPI003D3579E2
MRSLFIAASLLIATTTVAQTAAQKKATFINNLMKQMTLDEKIGQLNLVTPGGAVTGSVVSSDVEAKLKKGQVGGLFGIDGPAKIRQAQEIAVKESRLHIPLIFGLDVIHGHKTVFPIPLGLSASWDMALIERSARIAANEATADGLNWTFSPMVDISRDPRWGRISEGNGEDPYLGSQIAKAMVKGYQGDDLSKNNTLLACVKHFALYGGAEGGRDYNTVDMSKVRMYNEYLPPYKAAVEAGVGTVMSSFNVIDGVPATGNKWLLTDLLRKQWGFKGMVVSDYTSVNEMSNHGVGDLQAVSAQSLNAGLEMDMVGEGFLTTLKKSLKEGKVTLAQIETACRHILEAKYDLGLFDDPYRYCSEDRAKNEILSAANRAEARMIAARTFVLLKNEKQLLPLKKNGTIAVVGPLADSRRNMLGTWSVAGQHDKSVTVLEGIKASAGSTNVLYAKGANLSDDPVFAKKINVFGTEIEIDKRSPDEMIKEALEAASKSDVIVAVVGEAADMTGEASSMASLDIQPSQKKLLHALKATGKPIVMVLYTGRPLTLNWEAANMDAILNVWFGGTEGGNAVGDVLFGAYNPSGKLSASFPYSVGQIPVYHSMLNTGRPYNNEEFSKFKSNYLDIPNQPLFPFGFGLSYTKFEYSAVSLSASSLKIGGTIKATVTVKNTGSFDGEEVVQLYLRDVVGSISRPMRELKGFQKIFLKAGESKEVTFIIHSNDLKFYNSALQFVNETGDYELFIGTNSAETQKAAFKLTN